jgi:hypothetical protein
MPIDAVRLFEGEENASACFDRLCSAPLRDPQGDDAGMKSAEIFGAFEIGDVVSLRSPRQGRREKWAVLCGEFSAFEMAGWFWAGALKNALRANHPSPE